jgi:hypothetical protein
MTERAGWIDQVAEQLLDIGQSLGGRTGHMFGHPALYAGRRLAACAYGRGIALKLPAHRVDALQSDGRATTFKPYGKPAMKPWVHLEANTRQEIIDYSEIIAESLAFVDEQDEP